MNTDYLRLCLLTNLQTMPFSDYKKFILQVVGGGVSLVQLREKSHNIRQVRQMAIELKALLAPLKIPLIINDSVEIAKEIDADGVHLGQSDLLPDEARKFLGPGKIIGWSIECLEELNIANKLDSIDYIAASAVFSSKSKLNCKTYWGLEGLQKISQISRHPVVAIGGIQENNVREVMKAGACGVALIHALHNSSHPTQAAKALISEINEVIRERKNAK